jgi:trimeric autotransporter adhesin
VTNFNIDLQFSNDSLSASQRQAFNDAANRWSQVITSDIPDINGIDDLRIDVNVSNIDGVGNTLGSAGPTQGRADSLLPFQGEMTFDSSDLADIESRGNLDDLILHEMGHVLGIGTIWQQKGLLTGAGTEDPRFTGQTATAEYNQIFGKNETSIPVENTGGAGTRDAHWRESVFENELMTGFLNVGINNPLSRITIGSLADLGYQVDFNVAESFAPT